MGSFLANFKRGRGDYAGIAGRLNDGALITTYIYEFPPNDYGLYNMAGNVSEWVMDVYRPLSHQDFDDLNPIRRDDFLDSHSEYRNRYTKVEKDSTVTMPDGTTKNIKFLRLRENLKGSFHWSPIKCVCTKVDHGKTLLIGCLLVLVDSGWRFSNCNYRFPLRNDSCRIKLLIIFSN